MCMSALWNQYCSSSDVRVAQIMSFLAGTWFACGPQKFDQISSRIKPECESEKFWNWPEKSLHELLYLGGSSERLEGLRGRQLDDAQNE